MPHILADRHRPVLADFASANVLIGFDFDGTLAPIVASPAGARMRARTRRLLGEVAVRYPCVVISGRCREDVTARVACLPVWHVSGNHGLEPWGQCAAYLPLVRNWVRQLRAGLINLSGIVVEDKKYSLTIHYRQARPRPRALRTIRAEIRQLRGARVVGGHQCLNLMPQHAPGKKTALDHARRLLACDKAIFVGDDETDEDVFRSGDPGQLLGIRVGHTRRRTGARYHLQSQAEIDALLRALIGLRPLRRQAAQ